MKVIFFFGRTPEMAWAELISAYPGVIRISAQAATFELPDRTDPQDVLDRLGGSVKVAQFQGTSGSVEIGKLENLIRDTGGKVFFGISVYGSGKRYPRELPEELKKNLAGRGVRSRYLIPEHQTALSSVQAGAPGMQEIVVVETGESAYYGTTLAVQDIHKWQERDYGRPNADPKLGMLPPKVARMSVNIALGSDTSGKILLDPFCGMGTILAEGYLSDCHVYGGDLSPRVAMQAEANLKWLSEKHPDKTGRTIKIFVSDAAHISEKLAERTVDAIVTEPFMGTPKLGERGVDVMKTKNIVKGLDKMMLGSLKDWKRVLKPGGTVFIAMPTIVYGSKRYSVKRAIDTCEKLGYTKVLGPITYAREQAVVQRDFYLLRSSEEG